MSTPVVMCIDVEPDERSPSPRRTARWTGFERSYRLVRLLRPHLEEVTGSAVHLSWFLRMDPQIEVLHGDARWPALRYADELAGLVAAGDELGLHTHAWRWDPGRGGWINDIGDGDWQERCIGSSFAAYRAVFGSACRAHRNGDRFMDDRTLEVIERCGARVDLTIEPGSRRVRLKDDGLAATAALPAQWPVSRSPYRPSRANHLWLDRSNQRELWEIPLTAVDTSSSVPLLGRALRRLRWPARPSYRTIPPWGPWEPDDYWSWIEAEIASGRPVLAFALRSDFVLRATLYRAVRSKLVALLRRPLARRLRFVTASEAVRLI